MRAAIRDYSLDSIVWAIEGCFGISGLRSERDGPETESNSGLAPLKQNAPAMAGAF